MRVASVMGFVDAEVHILEVHGFSVQAEVVELAPIVHADHLWRRLPAGVQSIKDCPAQKVQVKQCLCLL